MNCKPGDLAVRIRDDGESGIKAGAIVCCLEFYPGAQHGLNAAGQCVVKHDVWLVEYRGDSAGPFGLRRGIPDSDLRPIRDPGDDAKDEMLRPLPAEPVSA